MTQLDPATRTYEDGVRACIEALPGELELEEQWTGNEDAMVFAVDRCRAALEALLPDPAEGLVREFWETYPKAKGWITPSRDETARWVIDYLTQNYTLEKK